MKLRSGLACLVLLACGGRATLDDPHKGQLSITVHNETGAPICEVHMYLASTTETGHNWLQTQSEIPTGASRAFWVPARDPAEVYQVLADGCPKRPFSGYAASVLMNGSASVILFDEASSASKEAAQAIAHANENTSLIPAKFSRGTTPRAR